MQTQLDPIEWLTVGLVIFAGAQVWVTNAAEVTRRNERAESLADREREIARQEDLAYQTVWAEHFRLEALADYWSRSNLVELSVLKVLRPEDLLPRDWSRLTEMLSRLSLEAGYFGGVAITLAHDIGRDVARLNGLVSTFAAQFSARSVQETVEAVRHNVGGQVGPLEKSINQRAADLAVLFGDAASHSSFGDKKRTLTFRDDLRSTAAGVAANAVAARSRIASHLTDIPQR